ncbi:serine/threonine protein kinase [Nostoc sp. 'Peltigera membranacea cyanobiont' 213]|uniref:serine/threonine protein kinase n=1 Tax=unclassified Nostoc TaxID=2593658 RepID=UPI000B958621|nr:MULTISPECIES: serine/threonine-protein kinase [unclassified Nostoc]AVH64498.1 serine/threonine protein kinase [Nostoc sp. 'Peltigera membranacea cyanobiont' N6]OYD97073.1 serine/threonine protein kinase [Nostoc sp. 'Peltigera membranacea cyanobiont' 213]
MSHITQSAVHCINPDCQRPYPQPWGNKFCNSCGAPLELLDRYVPLQPLGSGGFAQIYTVWDEKTQTEKVLKVLVEDSPKALELFTQEAAVLSSLQHPGVPTVDAEGYFQVQLFNPKPHQLPCLVMEKINGRTLEEILKKFPQGCPENLVVNWFAQAVEILQELHKRQIIHRDIKPSNLMLGTSSPTVTLPQGQTEGDRLVLIDFGGAKQFSASKLRSQSSSTRLFSSGYSPPEQVSGSIVGPSADFYALGRTVIEMLTGKYPLDLEDQQTGKLRWRSSVNVKPELADLLDEMVQEDVRSRPANAAMIQKRLAKISQPLPPPGLFAQLRDKVKLASTQVSQRFALIIQAIERVLANFSQAVTKTVVFIAQTLIKIFQACLATIWAMILAYVGACFGAIAGFILAYHTNLGRWVVEFISSQLNQLVPNTQPVFGADILVFVAAGWGTAWGLTVSGCFGQRRRFLVASLMGMISYGFGWFILQLITPKDSGEGLVAVILVSACLLTLSLGLRSHHIVYAVFAAFGSAIAYAFLIILRLAPPIFQFTTQPAWSELQLPLIFFGSLGFFISFWLGVSYYLIVPGLRFLGWR